VFLSELPNGFYVTASNLVTASSHILFDSLFTNHKSLYNVVGVATGYGLDD
jgi:hypothetical protein